MEQKESTERVIDAIASRMKEYEKSTELSIDPSKPVIVRIDGHKFSHFTRGFKRPFDERLHEAMRLTTQDLVEQFGPRIGYTESDEITLIFAECDRELGQEFLFSGRVQKLVSLFSSYTAVRFNYHLNKQDFSMEKDELKEKVTSMVAYFDARAFNVPDRKEALNNLIWRSLFDCRRNSVASLAQAHFSPKQLHGVGTTSLVEKLKTEKGIDWEQQDPRFKYGSYVKKELYTKTSLDPKTNTEVVVQRGRIVSKTFLLSGFSQENIDLVFNKYWNN